MSKDHKIYRKWFYPLGIICFKCLNKNVHHMMVKNNESVYVRSNVYNTFSESIPN